MHEMGIAQQIVDIAAGAIPAEAGDAPVESVLIRVGKLTAVVPESLRFCWEVITRDTRLAGSRLDIEEVPVVGRCTSCGAQVVIEQPPFACNECDGDLDFLSGRELMVKSLELTDPD